MRIHPKLGAMGEALGWFITPAEAAIPLRREVRGYLAVCVWWVYMVVNTNAVALPGND